MTRASVSPSSHPDARSGVRRALRLAARQAHASVMHADGVGVTLVVDGKRIFAGSNAYADRIDEVQYGLDEGPCVSALATRRIVHTAEVGIGERRWSRFTASTRDLALRSVFSTPVLADDVAIGTLNLYGRAPDTFATALPSIVRCTEEVGRSVHALHLLVTSQSGAQALVAAVADRADVDLAIGILIDRYAMTAGAARIMLSQLARLDEVSTAVAARSLIDGGHGR